MTRRRKRQETGQHKKHHLLTLCFVGIHRLDELGAGEAEHARVEGGLGRVEDKGLGKPVLAALPWPARAGDLVAELPAFDAFQVLGRGGRGQEGGNVKDLVVLCAAGGGGGGGGSRGGGGKGGGRAAGQECPTFCWQGRREETQRRAGAGGAGEGCGGVWGVWVCGWVGMGIFRYRGGGTAPWTTALNMAARTRTQTLLLLLVGRRSGI